MILHTFLPLVPMQCSRAYDIQGRLGEELTDGMARRIRHAFVKVQDARRVVVGRDCRTSSFASQAAVVDGLLAAGVDVMGLQLCGTEEMCFAQAIPMHAAASR